jgi:flagellar M-ring protein FliF
MNWLKNWIDEITRQFRRLELTRTQIVTIGMLGAAVALFLILVGVWGGTTDWAALSQAQVPPEELNEISSELSARGIEYRIENGLVEVPVDQRARAMALLAEGEVAGPDFLAGAFYYRDVMPGNNLLISAEQQRFQRQIARANELSRGLGYWTDIRQAKVEVSPAVHTTRLVDPVPAKASVMVFKPDPEKPLSQDTVNAIASFVSGAIEHLPVENVEVIDADKGRRMRVKNPDEFDVAADDRFEKEQKRAAFYAQKIRDTLETVLNGYEEQIKVNVDVALNLEKRHTESKTYDPERPGAIVTERTESEMETTRPPSGDVMTPPMTRGTVETAAGGGGTEETTSTSRTDSKDHSYVKENIVHVSGQATDISASVVLPFDAMAELALKRVNKEQFDTPDEKETAVATLREEFERMIRNALLVKDADTGDTPDAPREARVTVVAWPMLEAPAMAVVSPSTGQQVKLYVLSHLSEIGLAVMTLGAFLVLLKALKQGQEVPVYDAGGEEDEEEIPDLEDLLPKTPVDMTNLRLQKMNDAIADAVGQNPTGSASLLKRWITREN